jgi:small GTP-binding protein
MPEFDFDVFLSHSSKDKPIVKKLAERLRADGIRVWFDAWCIRPGDSIPSKIEEGLERSRVLVLCMSANAFSSEWAQLEAGTFRFRDPLNKERRFIPVRLDNTPIRGSLAQFLCLDWSPEKKEDAYTKLLEACSRPLLSREVSGGVLVAKPESVIALSLSAENIGLYAFTPDFSKVAVAADDEIHLWDPVSRRPVRSFRGHKDFVRDLGWISNDRILSVDEEGQGRIFDVNTGKTVHVLSGHNSQILCVALDSGRKRALTGATGGQIRMWDVETGRCTKVFRHDRSVTSIAWGPNQNVFVSGHSSGSPAVCLWDADQLNRIRRFDPGHVDVIWGLAWSGDGRRVISSSFDRTIRLWDVATGHCSCVFEGHTDEIWDVVWPPNNPHFLSACKDGTIRVWNANTAQCAKVLVAGNAEVLSVAWDGGKYAYSGDGKGVIQIWDLSEFIAETAPSDSSSRVQYTNAKVLLVGDSGAGKTGLSKVLAGQRWAPSDSTVGAWAAHWKLPMSSNSTLEREIWLWDFGGQADQRLIHQLYMDDTALAVLVFDGQKEDVFETIRQWDRDLTRASKTPFSKLLVAGRTDAGGLRISRSQLEEHAKQLGFPGVLETSAKVGTGCEELKQAIITQIRWERVPWRSSPVLFRRLKEEIIRLKDAGRVLMRFNELRETLQLRLTGEARFTDDELSAVIGLLSGPGVVWQLKFGSWMLLQPERINAYAQAVIRTLREDPHERGCIAEERVLNGYLTYQSSMARLSAEDERIVLLAMHQFLIERGLCLREHTDKGPLLIFPSYYRRERPELTGHPAVLVSYQFKGFLDDLYATLIVRLHHTLSFQQDQLWQFAADFKTLTGKQLGVKLMRRAEGAGELQVYFDPSIAMEEKIIFSKYIDEHLRQNAAAAARLRHYVCPHCRTAVGNREVAMTRLQTWLDSRPAGGKHFKSSAPTIICVNCEERVPLWDEMEQCFASAEVQERVRQLQEQSNLVLDSESKERALVGEIISTVALAGQICREKVTSDHGIDMEIEFKDDAGQATGKMVYLQLKSGDSYLTKRKSDGAEIFRIQKARHAEYWRSQAFPVMLVIRNANGEIRWIDVREHLMDASQGGKKQVKQVVFTGERFDAMSVRRWRAAALNPGKDA